MRHSSRVVGAGAYFGEGRSHNRASGLQRAGGISSFLLGIVKTRNEGGEVVDAIGEAGGPGKAGRGAGSRTTIKEMLAFCKAGSGYDLESLDKIRRELEGKLERVKPLDGARARVSWLQHRGVPLRWRLSHSLSPSAACVCCCWCCCCSGVVPHG